MAESIREVIARMKNNQQSSQVSKPVVVQKEEEQDDYLDEIETKKPIIETKKPVEEIKNQDVNISEEQRIHMEIEMLQNNGRYRVELLSQLQEINKALVVIAGVMVDFSDKNGKT